MFGSEGTAATGVDTVAHVIQVALTPVFLLSGIASLLGVFAGRLARVADRVDAISTQLDGAEAHAKPGLVRRLSYLQRRSRTLDVAVILGACGGAATCAAALTLFLGSIRERAQAGLLFVAFGAALLFTIGALSAFLLEMLMASRGLREFSATRMSDPADVDVADVDDAVAHDQPTLSS